VAAAWAAALGEVRFTKIQDAIRTRDVASLKSLWNKLVPIWDDRTFYDFVASSDAFSKLSFHHREVFVHAGFGTGGWDSARIVSGQGFYTYCGRARRIRPRMPRRS